MRVMLREVSICSHPPFVHVADISTPTLNLTSWFLNTAGYYFIPTSPPVERFHYKIHTPPGRRVICNIWAHQLIHRLIAVLLCYFGGEGVGQQHQPGERKPGSVRGVGSLGIFTRVGRGFWADMLISYQCRPSILSEPLPDRGSGIEENFRSCLTQKGPPVPPIIIGHPKFSLCFCAAVPRDFATYPHV